MSDLLARSGLRRTEFASRLGTSRSRLSTYLSGTVVPSAALMVRAQRVALSDSERVTGQLPLVVSAADDQLLGS